MDPYDDQLRKYIEQQERLRKRLQDPINNFLKNHPANKYAEIYGSIHSQFDNPAIQNAININKQFQDIAEGPLKVIREQQEQFKKMISQMDNIYNQDFYLKNSINELDVKESTEFIENKISSLSTKKELSFKEQSEIIEVLLFISDQEGENPDDFIKSFRSAIRSFVDSKEKISEKINNTSSETNNTKDEEKISKHELPPSFIEELFSKEKFQDNAIAFIYTSLFTWVVSLVNNHLDPYIFLMLVSLFVSIFNRDKDK